MLDIRPVPIILSDGLEIGDGVTIFGYGKNEESVTIPQAEDFKAGYMEVAEVEGWQFGVRFDDTGSASCFGDEGGPATQVVEGVTGIVGVSSFGILGCQALDRSSGFIDVQNPQVGDFILTYAPDVAVR